MNWADSRGLKSRVLVVGFVLVISGDQAWALAPYTSEPWRHLAQSVKALKAPDRSLDKHVPDLRDDQSTNIGNFIQLLISDSLEGLTPQDLMAFDQGIQQTYSYLSPFVRSFNYAYRPNYFHLRGKPGVKSYHAATIGTHSLRVAKNIDKIAAHFPMATRQKITLRLAALFHDTGKLIEGGYGGSAWRIKFIRAFLMAYPRVVMILRQHDIRVQTIIDLLEEKVNLAAFPLARIHGTVPQDNFQERLNSHLDSDELEVFKRGGLPFLNLVYYLKIADVMGIYSRRSQQTRYSEKFAGFLEEYYQALRSRLQKYEQTPTQLLLAAA